MTATAEAPAPTGPAAALDGLVERHAELLDRARRAVRERTYWSAYPESPSPRVQGPEAATRGEAAYRALLGARFELGQPDDGTEVGDEVSPYGPALQVRYPHACADRLLTAASAALPAWRAASPRQRAAVAAEILARVYAGSFEIAHAVMHTSGQAFVMAFQAGGPHAQDRGLEAVAYALEEQERHAGRVVWSKPQGNRPPLRMELTFTPVPRGIALVVGCVTFPTWNSYPGLFASLVTGNAVVVKPHPRAVLPLAITVRIAREVLAEHGFDPDVVLLAAERPDERLAATLATDPRVGIVDFTGSTAFGEWLERHAGQAQVHTEKAGVNGVLLESTDDYRGALANLAVSLTLYSGQMCTTPQNLYVPRSGVRTDEGTKAPDDVGRDLGAALDALLADDERAAGLLGAVVTDDVADRLQAAAAGGAVVVASRAVPSPAWPDARIRTPLVLRASSDDEDRRERWQREQFGPITYLVETADRDEALDLLEDLARTRGALTAMVHSTDADYLERAREAALRCGVALSENLTGGVHVNQTAAFSDFHATGANPAANSSYTDAHFVAGRFRVVESRRPLGEDS